METPKERHDRGAAMVSELSEVSVDWMHHEVARKRLTSSERATFDLEFIKARSVAGVRPAVDIALAEMRKKLGQRLGKTSWRAGT